ncbi:MAG: hypothetical protein GX096_11545 [Clostridiales bacterium]|nr:hypothetical protein [Clostridiales bacterium]
MNDLDHAGTVSLEIPAKARYALVACIAMSGVGLLAGLDVDQIGDLRTVTEECCDCLIHQPHKPTSISLNAQTVGNRLHLTFTSKQRLPFDAYQDQNLDITRGVLETLMPVVHLHSDENGVYSIECSMPV